LKPKEELDQLGGYDKLRLLDNLEHRGPVSAERSGCVR
jgi:hypothetical protein